MRGKGSDRQFRKKLMAGQKNLSPPRQEEHMREVVRSAKTAFYEGELDDILTGAEFLFWQAGYIHKRWWILQGMLLMALWLFLCCVSAGDHDMQRLMGVAAPLFGIFILPEIWKNREANALEVEGAAYYSLRQIYAARLFLFGLVDVAMLTAFGLALVGGGRILMEEILFQFFLPLTVTGCICFRTLYSRRIGSEAAAVFLCLLWSAVWLQFVILENVYEKVAVPVWYGVLAAAFFYLIYCIYRGQKSCMAAWEKR